MWSRLATLVGLAWLLACAAVPSVPPAPAVLWLGGDVHLGAGDGGALRAVLELTHGEPLVVNLEGPIGDAQAASAPRLVNGPGAVAALRTAGVVAAGVENNHADDLGPAGRDATRRALTAGGVVPLGAASVQLGRVQAVLVSVDLSTVSDVRALEATLRRERGAAPVLVVGFHVTAPPPPSYLPTPELEAAVEVALAAGASVVVAHGTHALARVERRGAAVIAWGLGNLVFDCRCTDEVDGLLLRVEVDARGRLSRATVVPIDAGLHGAPVRPAGQSALTLELLESLGASPLRRLGGGADF